ncbi:MAG: tripartite tricarboxylate transporter TctB family protein [Candidatus Accumulibacter sp.]|jgi:putative tricarboxylic transport membrane protein|nr:tripartite tricarboxylate transporter TctB family protein [Accumulibacter sp.]
MKKADISGGVIGILIGIFAILEGRKMPADVVMGIGPSFFPNFLAGFLVLFSAALLINALRGKSKGTVEPFRLADKGAQRGLITLGASIVYCIAFEPLGFIPTSIVFFVFMALVLGKRRPLTLIAAPALITAGIWLVFEKVLNLSLPPGILVDVL